MTGIDFNDFSDLGSLQFGQKCPECRVELFGDDSSKSIRLSRFLRAETILVLTSGSESRSERVHTENGHLNPGVLDSGTGVE